MDLRLDRMAGVWTRATALAIALATADTGLAADLILNDPGAGFVDVLDEPGEASGRRPPPGEVARPPTRSALGSKTGRPDNNNVESGRLERPFGGGGLRIPAGPGSGELAMRLPDLQVAQFQLPPKPPPSERAVRPPELPSDLKFGYAYGSDTEITYRKDSDLDKRLKDNFTWFAPTLFAFVDYRPTSWLETRLEATVERIFPLNQQNTVTLPTGETVRAEKQALSLLIDQAYVTVKNVVDPLESITVGRRNYEDARLWLYDAALDAFIVKHKLGHFHTEASVSRENVFDGDVLRQVKKGLKIVNYIAYTEYRGIEDHKIAGYAIHRDSKQGVEGRPLFLGVRAYGNPSDRFKYWSELGFARGKDQFKTKLKGYAYEIGGTYRFPDAPLQPSITLGYGYGSGDKNPNDNKNTEFWQTGLQSNEARFGGVTQFKAYGEVIDPELSNLRIFTAGVGFRPAPNFFVDLVYHRYRANAIADQIRNWALTAQMNQDDTHLSKDVGSEFDVILGFRNLFGLRRLGFEARLGWFFPGNAFRNAFGDPDDPRYRGADRGFSALFVIII